MCIITYLTWAPLAFLFTQRYLLLPTAERYAEHVTWRNQHVSGSMWRGARGVARHPVQCESDLENWRRTGGLHLKCSLTIQILLNLGHLSFLLVCRCAVSPEPTEMIRNGHHATSEPREEADCTKPGSSACSPEKRKRVVRLWCDGWWVCVPASICYSWRRLIKIFSTVYWSDTPLLCNQQQGNRRLSMLLLTSRLAVSNWAPGLICYYDNQLK